MDARDHLPALDRSVAYRSISAWWVPPPPQHGAVSNVWTPGLVTHAAICFCSTLLAVTPSLIVAQVRPAVGEKVRLWTEQDSARIGVVFISPPDSIRISDTLGVHTFAYAAITRLEVNRRDNLDLQLGGGGAILGAFVGVLISTVTFDCPPEEICISEALGRWFISGVVGAAIGFGLGALVGTLIQSERWEPIHIRPSQPGQAGFFPGSFTVGVRLRW